MSDAYLDIALPTRLQIIKDLATAIDGLAIQELFDEPEYETRLALF